MTVFVELVSVIFGSCREVVVKKRSSIRVLVVVRGREVFFHRHRFDVASGGALRHGK